MIPGPPHGKGKCYRNTLGAETTPIFCRPSGSRHWLRKRDLHPRMLVYETSALAVLAIPQCLSVCRPTGSRTRISPLKRRDSGQLSYQSVTSAGVEPAVAPLEEGYSIRTRIEAMEWAHIFLFDAYEPTTRARPTLR